jgi:2-iminobutanoate/2-iminopropanoate deaminase
MIEFLDPLGTTGAGHPYSPVVKAGNLVFISGQIGIDRQIQKLAEGIAGQTRQPLRNIFELLETQGLHSQNIVKTTVFMVNVRDFALMNAAYHEAFGANLPARSTIEVSSLPVLEALIEIEAIATTN